METKSFLSNKYFCSASLPLASTGWAQSTIKLCTVHSLSSVIYLIKPMSTFPKAVMNKTATLKNTWKHPKWNPGIMGGHLVWNPPAPTELSLAL